MITICMNSKIFTNTVVTEIMKSAKVCLISLSPVQMKKHFIQLNLSQRMHVPVLKVTTT